MRIFQTPLLLALILLTLGSSMPARAQATADIEAAWGELPIPESAKAIGVIEDGEAQLAARLLVSNDSGPRIGVQFDLAPGWHLYWRNPGETGIAPSLGLDASPHRIGTVAWPAPKTFHEADGLFTTYGYDERVLLVAPIEAVGTLAKRDLIRAEISVLVCRRQCVPATFSLSTPFEIGLSESEQASVDVLFRDAAATVPITAAALGLKTEARWTELTPALDETRQLELALRSCRGDDASCPTIALDTESELFIPLEGDAFEFSNARLLSGDDAVGATTIGMQVTRLEDGEDRLRGLIAIRDTAGRPRHVELDLEIRSDSATAGASLPIGLGGWTQIFLLALLGGLILNAMPCVLPVLAIKVVAIADMADKDRREVRLHGLAYTGGVLASMALLSILVIGLRAAGHSVGWGFQFQEPLFVAAISALLVAFALNLFGVFEIEFGQGRLASVGQDASGLQRSAFEGLLAVILATPCTAPFLGTAVGFAFASSGFGIAAIFLAIGLGLASPFLMVSFFPKFARFIPRSGPWMMKLRGGLGFSLLASVVWLLWVLGQVGGMSAVIAMVANLLFLAFLLWGFGQMQPVRSVWLARAGAIMIVSLASAGFNLIDFDRAEDRTTSEASGQADSGWRPYSERAVAETLAAGLPAFVVFTADWCITCQVNEETVLDRQAVHAAFAANDFALFKADWTRRDEMIRLKLAEFGRAGVPLYLVYSPENPDRPQVLSELLTQREVIAAVSGPRMAGRG